MRIEKRGDGLVVRLPAELVERLGLKEGDDVDLTIQKARVAATPEEREAILAKLRRFRGMVPADFKFDREEANERPPRGKDSKLAD